MDPVTISRYSIEQFEDEPNLAELFAQYAAESSIAGLGAPVPQFDMYRAMEAAGLLHVVVAHRGGRMIGFMSFLVSRLPHYGQVVATSESFFVDPDERAGGPGLMLLREAERLAVELGAMGLFVSAPVRSRLDEILPRLGYGHTNQVFFKGLQ